MDGSNATPVDRALASLNRPVVETSEDYLDTTEALLNKPVTVSAMEIARAKAAE